MRRRAATAAKWVHANAGDVLELSGLGVIVSATWQLHPVAGMYALGVVLALLGALKPRKKGR